MNDGPPRVFLLSPASCRGRRASFLLSPRSSLPLAEALRRGEAPLGEVFSFVSGLYFRGKLAYARTFARPPSGLPGVFVVTPIEGLRRPEHPMGLDLLRAYASHDIDAANPLYTEPLRRDAALVRESLPDAQVVLLGSVATSKYASVLSAVFGEKLVFPAAFVGRGDMSRGGLLLRHARSGVELDYRTLAAGPVTGPRPPRLERLKGSSVFDPPGGQARGRRGRPGGTGTRGTSRSRSRRRRSS